MFPRYPGAFHVLLAIYTADQGVGIFFTLKERKLRFKSVK